jgi:hypothetical protein
MPPIVNTHHAEAWNGWEGDLWAQNPDRYDRMKGARSPGSDAIAPGCGARRTPSRHAGDGACP